MSSAAARTAIQKRISGWPGLSAPATKNFYAQKAMHPRGRVLPRAPATTLTLAELCFSRASCQACHAQLPTGSSAKTGLQGGSPLRATYAGSRLLVNGEQ